MLQLESSLRRSFYSYYSAEKNGFFFSIPFPEQGYEYRKPSNDEKKKKEQQETETPPQKAGERFSWEPLTFSHHSLSTIITTIIIIIHDGTPEKKKAQHRSYISIRIFQPSPNLPFGIINNQDLSIR
jgi:hypothetical protein